MSQTLFAAQLDALISTELGKDAKRTELNTLRKAPSPTVELAARILELEELLDWRPISQHFLTILVQCRACGRSESHFDGLLTKMLHRHSPAIRYARADQRRLHLPLTSTYQELLKTPICPGCAFGVDQPVLINCEVLQSGPTSRTAPPSIQDLDRQGPGEQAGDYPIQRDAGKGAISGAERDGGAPAYQSPASEVY